MATAEEKAAAKLAQEQAAAEKAAADEVAAAEQAAAAAKAEAEAAAATDKKGGKKFDAVCLRDCDFGLAGEVVQLTTQEINVGKAQGAIDDHVEAVAYARASKGE
ncbi:hypothetical protein UFOVP814_23 [uncultured Caudovirales phage]|uniref:Uncharacterized protein n=1 Tax=uncultured Caudovirales phage TaxID=2100421 RepID=A0A6J5NWL4_9CAUD|nr:hypothetical protein UFOVP814_23 [uncultured Caudovirales phage]